VSLISFSPEPAYWRPNVPDACSSALQTCSAVVILVTLQEQASFLAVFNVVFNACEVVALFMEKSKQREEPAKRVKA
jgi:hypothetical protein